jgi:hypothetical protein
MYIHEILFFWLIFTRDFIRVTIVHLYNEANLQKSEGFIFKRFRIPFLFPQHSEQLQ